MTGDIWHRCRLAGLALGCCVLSGCHPQMPLDFRALAQVMRIGLTGFAEPAYAAGGPNEVKAILQPLTARLNAEMKNQNLRLGAEMKSAISEALERSGFRVAAAPEAADVMLEGDFVAVQYEPVNPLIGSGVSFTPEVLVRFELTEPASHKRLFAKVYDYSALAGADFHPDRRYAFEFGEDILNDPGRAAAGFRASEPLIATSVAAALAQHHPHKALNH